jgi:hypothetical protein
MESISWMQGHCWMTFSIPMPRGTDPCSRSMTMMTAVSSRTSTSKETKQQWRLTHPPQKTARAVHVHVLFTLLLFALRTADRLQCGQEATGGEPVGWQRWRRQLLAHTRDHVIVFAQDCYGIFHMAEYSLLSDVQLKDVPPGIGTHQDILAKYRLPAHG